MPLLAGDCALVTGAGVGIGRAIAEAVAGEGARVFLTDVPGGQAEAAARAIMQSGGTAASVEADLSQAGSSDAVIDAAMSHFGDISVFVHCASPRHRQEPVLDVTESAWDEMLAVNIRAGYRLARRLGIDMRDKKIRGRMLFVTSLHASTPRNVAHYSATKAALTMLMAELAKALGPHGIRVNAIAPGTISGNWYAGAEVIANATPLGRIGKPSEVAGTAIALLSDRFSSFITGTTVTVDGGLSLNNWLD